MYSMCAHGPGTLRLRRMKHDVTYLLLHTCVAIIGISTYNGSTHFEGSQLSVGPTDNWLPSK